MAIVKLYRPANQLICPLCPRPLDRIAKGVTHYFFCPDHGIFAPLSFFESFKTTKPLIREFMNARKIPTASRAKPLACSYCGNRMRTTLFRKSLVLDQCFTCNGIWFDLGEINSLSKESELEKEFPPAPSMPNVNHDGKGAINWPSAEAHVSTLRPENWFGLPAEDDNYSRKNFPYATFGMMAVCFLFTVRVIKDPVYVSQNIFLPDDPFRHHGLTLLTSTFMHAGFGHLAGNLAFLYICGDNVEDVVGPQAFIFMILAGAIFGDLLYVYGGGTLPALGASGGIYSIVIYYAFAFPKNRFSFPIPYRRRWTGGTQTYDPDGNGIFSTMGFYTLSLSAPLFLGAMALNNLVSAYFQAHARVQSGTNFLAHAGGIGFGVFAYLMLGLKPKTKPTKQ